MADDNAKASEPTSRKEVVTDPIAVLEGVDHLEWNGNVICVDDEPDVLDVYEQILSADLEYAEEEELIARSRARRRRRGKDAADEASAPTPSGPSRVDHLADLQLFVASSGEEAVEIAKAQHDAGDPIAAGFFDMKMPGGMDGLETIREILKIDSRLQCAVVTAYTDRSIKSLGELFYRQDQWIYFNKPFSEGELQQAARNLLSGWNLRQAQLHSMQMLETRARQLEKALDAEAAALERAEALNRDLRDMQEELVRREKLSAVGRMAARVVHDLDNAATIISAYAELLADGSTPEQHPHYVQRIHDAVDQIGDMAQNILAFARGEVRVRPRTVDVADYFERLTSFLGRIINDSSFNVELSTNVEGTAHIDTESIRRAISNLARNAYEAIEDDGTFRLEVTDHDDDLRIRCSDTGPGVPDEIRQEVFDEFVSHGKRRGTGLGLAITKAIIEDHGGTVRYDDEYQEGASFIIDLPLVRQDSD